MQEQFVINTTTDFDSSVCTLALLVGNDYFSYAVSDDKNNVIVLKRYYLQNTGTKQLDDILQLNNVLSENFANIVTAFDFNSNTLLPVDLNTGDHTSLLYLNDAAQQDHIMYEVVKDWQLSNVYSIPYSLLNWALRHFPSSKFWHAQSVQIQNAGKENINGGIHLEVRDKNFNVTVTLHDKLLLAQTYPYTTPSDVLFYLLKICEGFGLAQDSVLLTISGLVDKNSALFKTLYDYFLNIDMKSATWQPDEYPAHYFTLLNQVALCES